MSVPPPPVPPYITNWASLLFPRHFLHISIAVTNHSTALIANNQVQQLVNGANDWLRYADNCWIVWTNESPDDWYKKLAAIAELKDSSIFVVKIDLSPANRSGQFPKWIWDWIDKKRG